MRKNKVCNIWMAILLALALATGSAAGIAEAKTTSSAAKAKQAKTATKYSGNRKTHVFHRSSCRYYACKNCTVVFASRTNALKAGYKPCKVCKP